MSLGRELLTASPRQLLKMEADEGKTQTFWLLDTFMSLALSRCMRGDRLVERLARGARLDGVRLPWLDSPLRSQLKNRFQPTVIQERGGWFLPEKGKVLAGWIDLPALIDVDPRFAVSTALSLGGSTALGGFEEVVAWAVLGPTADVLFAPFEIRGHLAGRLKPDDARQRLAEYKDLLSSVGMEVGDTLNPFLSGRDWAVIRSPDKVHARRALRAALASAWHEDAPSLLRARQLLDLVDQYYSKAEDDGTALRRRVVTKQFAPHMVALFGGDWLELLSYIGEMPHRDEEVIQALPEAELYVPSREQIEEVGARTGTPVDEMNKIAAAMFGDVRVHSPVEDRVATLRQIWSQVDDAHARQQSGGRALPDFATNEFVMFYLVEDAYAHVPPQTSSFDRVLGSETLAGVHAHWGTAVFERWPDRLYTELLPFRNVLAAFGPALEFWHGVGLTAWYVAEGPSSRTEILGMPSYYGELLKRMAGLGHPVADSFFDDLKRAEKLLGPPQSIEEEIWSEGPITATISRGSRRTGFHHLRDVVTEHRRAWAAQHLEAYLDKWQDDLEDVHRAYNRHLADKGRNPTLRQFAAMAAPAANAWFGGNLERIYVAIGESSPVDPRYDKLMPDDPWALAEAVFKRLGGRPLKEDLHLRDHAEGQRERAQVYNAADAGRASLKLIQVREAKGADPTISEFGRSRWQRFSSLFPSEEAQSWQAFLDLVDDAVANLNAPEHSVQQAPPSPTPESQTAPDETAPGQPPRYLVKPKRRGLLGRLLDR